MVKKAVQRKEGSENVQARKVVNMAIGSLSRIPVRIDEGQYCPDVIQQLDSVIGLLHRARKELLAGHLESCLGERLRINKEGAIKELLKIYNIK